MQGEDIRYINNPFIKVFNIIQPDTNKVQSLLLTLIQQFFTGVSIPTTLAISSDPHENQHQFSAYTGCSGYTYTLLRLVKFFRHEHTSVNQLQKYSQGSGISDTTLNQLMNPDFYLQKAIKQQQVVLQLIKKQKTNLKSISFYMSTLCTWVCGMNIAFEVKNYESFRQNQAQIVNIYNNITKHHQSMQFQVLYGIPGFLYTILQLQNTYDKQAELYRTNFGPLAINVTHMIIKQGIRAYEQMMNQKVNLDDLPKDFRLVYTFHKKQYLGGAHGLGGNLNIILLAMKLNNFGEHVTKLMNLIQASIVHLLRHYINGNFTTATGSKRTKLVHFCHGAPGIVHCLARFTDMFPQKAINLALPEVIKQSLDHIWKYGVLKKGFGLCHGISGNAYSFISPAVLNIFPEYAQQHRKKALLFALLRQEKQVLQQIKGFDFKDRFTVGISDNPFSLMLGIAGDICFVIDAISGVGKFPGFDF